MESDDEDIDIQDLSIEDEPLPSCQSNGLQNGISGLSMVFKANRHHAAESRQAIAGSSLEASTSSTNEQDSGRAGSDQDPARLSKHSKRKSDETHTPSSSAVSSMHMSRHGRSSSSSSSNSDASRERPSNYLPMEERWSSSFSPTHRPTYMPGTSPLGTSPGFDSYLSRRRSLGQQPGVSPYSPGSSPTYSSFATYHGRASTAPANIGGHSPAFGASSPPILPLHAHLQQGHSTRTEDVIAHLAFSPHAHAEISPCPPPDADEPWIDLPPSVDASLQSPTREHASPQWGVPRSPITIPTEVNLERRRSDPSGITRSPGARPIRKANSSPARMPLRLSLSHTGQQGLKFDETQRLSTSPASSSHQHGNSDPIDSASDLRSPRRRPLQADQTPSGLSTRRDVPHDLEIGLPLARQKSQSPSRASQPLSVSPIELDSSAYRPYLASGGRSGAVAEGRQSASSPSFSGPPSTPPKHSPSGLDDLTQSPIEMDLSGDKRQTSPVEYDTSSKLTFFKPDAKLFPPAPNHDLSMPPRSGWDLSDDADVSPLEEKSLEEAQESFDMDHDTSEEHDQDSAELRPDRSPSSPTIGTIPLPSMESENDDSPEWGAPLDFNRGPAVELETLSPEEHLDADPQGNDGFQIDMDEEGLTPLERIFLFAKSEHADHRETVSRMLPVWIEDVEICEAVDYILPLFQGMLHDEDFVKEAFASSLDKLMWFFFSVRI